MPTTDSASRLRPYRIEVSDAVLADLKDRLRRTRWPTEIPQAHWKYGADAQEIRTLCEYWSEHYDWRQHEARLNQIPQFTVEIDGVDIHFLWKRASRRAAMPLLLLHGWPGSIIEFVHLIEPLTNPASDDLPAFDVVVPSLPGFGFSGKPREAGWSADRMAKAFHQLMTRELGYGRFGIQGGDWGTIIGTRLTSAFPDAVRGLHINMPYGYPTSTDDPQFKAHEAFVAAETGYLHLQNTKPDAMTLAQTDSPAGLAAWVLEKFRTWSDCGGDLLRTFDKDTLLTNLMLYWATESAASATRIYYESAHLDPPLFLHPRITVPTGIAVFPKEPYRAPRHWLEPRFNIQRWTEMPRGGHFPALEQPQLLLDDARAFFAALSTEHSS